MSDCLTDCLIIGGGVIGLSLAHELAGQGMSVHVVDQGPFGREASWAGAGILPPQSEQGSSDALTALGTLSSQLHAEWATALRDETGIDTGYRRTGGWNLATDTAAAEELRLAVQQWHGQDVEARIVDRDELARLEPALADERRGVPIEAACLLPGEAQVRNPRHLKALLAACQRRGVTLSPHTSVTDIQNAGDRVVAVQTSTGRLTAGHYCVTAGAWSGGLLTRLGVSASIHPRRGQIVLLASAVRLLDRVVNVGARYLVPRPDGRVLVGSTVEDVGFDKRTTAEAVDGLLRFALDLVPALGDATVEQTWAGLRPHTADGLPYLGRVPGLDNISVATGHFRGGLHLSTGTAVVMSQLIRGENPSIDLSPFAITRQ